MRIQITDVCSEVLEEEFIVSKRGVIFVKVKTECLLIINLLMLVKILHNLILHVHQPNM